MASKELGNLSESEKTNLCLSYATLLLVDGKKSVSAKNLGLIFDASNCKVD